MISQHVTQQDFFIKRKSQNILGFYDENFICSADYDLFYRMIVREKMKGKATMINEIIGKVSSGGFSSKFGFVNHIIEENRIRLKHKQNKLFIFFSLQLTKLLKD